MSAIAAAPSEAAGLFDADYRLEDRYARQTGRVYLTGTQALMRAVLDQARRDREAGLDTAGFVSGYRGSPLGGVDLEAWRVKSLLDEHRIEFLPAVNEDLAATAILGTQQVESDPNRTVEGVFGLWYGKGPGVDRAGDALKHGNAYGSSPHGGVLVVAGDDHGCVSSSMPHQSDVAFMAWFMPTLNPASIAEYLSFAEYGYALSRFSGMWVGFKAVSETVEAAASLELCPPRRFARPDYTPPPSGLHYRWPDLPGPQIEERLVDKKAAVFAFAEANPIDRAIYDIKDARYGIVTTGKGHLDLLEALRLIGLDEAECRRLGIDIYKVGLVWPLARGAALRFVRGKEEVLVVEEKRGIIESQFKEYFYDFPGEKPQRMVGKRDEDGERLVPWTGELSPRMLAPLVARRLDRFIPELGLPKRAASLAGAADRTIQVPGATRTPYFCSGCPHNSSTRVPEGSQALAGIGCHFMASWMDRDTTSLIQMGGEGVNWAASSRFTGNRHVFQNLGEGTYYHSGSMAIRQAVAAKANITYKILFNDAVAMTGGQPVDGPISVHAIAHMVRAEGVARVALVSDTPEKFAAPDLPAGTTIHHRSELDAVQRELRDILGVTVLIYEQTCATEKRRRRKRGTMEDPKRFAVINDLVCEGCGDCSKTSNCLSVEPKPTPFGTKRRISLSNCNKDFSCLDGFCPSFVTVEGGERRRPERVETDAEAKAGALPHPVLPSLAKPFDLLVTGVGGTGVITVGALIAMAAHLEGKGASVLDFTGFAQKFGPVLSYLRLADRPEAINQVRIDEGSADALIGCDIVVSSSPKASNTYRAGMKAAVNMAEMPTGDIVRLRDADLQARRRLKAIERVAGPKNVASFDANAAAETLLGDAVFANVMMLGFAWQGGLVPVGLAALDRAITLNGVAIEKNREAFAIGRLARADPDGLAALLRSAGGDPEPEVETLDQLVSRREAFLTAYQDAAYARRFRAAVDRVRQASSGRGGEALAEAVARSLFKLMAYKDEYEVARLHTDPAFHADIARRFTGDYRLNFHLAPPMLNGATDAGGRPLKKRFGPWMIGAFRMLAPMKRLRGTPFDPFGYTEERRMERALVGWYEGVVDQLLARLGEVPEAELVAIAAAPMDMRGYGPVKQAAVAEVKAAVEARLAALEDGAGTTERGDDDRSEDDAAGRERQRRPAAIA
ncbi:indolepyruvate ferredoxin oxidoreductase family protein [Aurantimonas sp. VKM B-3413]|uniref:indolepyruvate ferredoxin oxidoreductase family protein n=1 Tax=Aurantimonas sp. VKM B-3413 TaxID=2779401 RepID=UPI001E2F470E|nr:indolepyruvate ferredoxin oxidoreductase family protein [Aurantimonas sp. VKM B-3413]MCB8836366.1 indolepyruvate ferredoxin oxidoreductase family protein [Aurantimonas sp. VKM B-3413]